MNNTPEPDYTVTVNGLPVSVHSARVSAHPLNQVWPGYQRPLEQTELAAFASWDMAGPAEVQVTCARPIQEVRVRPTSRGIQPRIDGNQIRFTVSQPGQFTVEVNGSHHALHLFADPPETGTPDPQDPSVRYFGPGIHQPGLITLTSGQSLYLAGGAVVYGAVAAANATDIAITGRGILDGSKFDRMELTGLISLHACNRVRIAGITLRDPGGFTIVPSACQEVRIQNVKLIGNWRYNSDGIDFINCQHCSVEDSFIRSFDDSICLKGYDHWGPFIYALQLFEGKFDGSFTLDGKTRHLFSDLQRAHGRFPCLGAPLHDIQVRRCVIWNDWGRALEVGLETVATQIHAVLFEDCDIIHVAEVAMDIQNGDHAHCHDITFRDIRVELDDCARPQYQGAPDQRYSVPPGDRHLPRVIELRVLQGYCNYSAERGQITDIRFENIHVTAPGLPPSRLSGFDAGHRVQQVTIENLRLNGQIVTTLAAAGITANEFVREVTIRAGAPRILFLGNSITKHPPKSDIGWTGNWGMAASAQDKDYVHHLIQRFAAAAGGTVPEVRIENIAEFEREHRTFDVTTKFKAHADFKADTIILAIGENVPALTTEADKVAFHTALTKLLALLKQNHTPALFVRSSFWADPVKDAILRQVCQDAGGIFIDIHQLGTDEQNYARSEREFSDPGVAAHPGDAGMAAIAEAIWNAISRNKVTNQKQLS